MAKKKTPPASQSDDNSQAGSATADCPLRKRGDIKFILRWRHDNSLVKGARISITGPSEKEKKTSSNGQAMFKKVKPGAYEWWADYSGLGDRQYLLKTSSAGRVGSMPETVQTVRLFVAAGGGLKVELREAEEGGGAGALLDAAVVEAISIPGDRRQGAASVEFSHVPVGDVQVSAALATTDWRLVNGQSRVIEVKRDKTVTLVLRAEEIAEICVEVIDQEGPDGPRPLNGAQVTLLRGDRAMQKVTTGAGLASHTEQRDGPLFEIDEIEMPGDGYWQLVDFESA